MNLQPINPYTVNKINEELRQQIKELEAENQSLKAQLSEETEHE